MYKLHVSANSGHHQVYYQEAMASTTASGYEQPQEDTPH